MKKLVEKQWDYTKHAQFYIHRPNYSPKTIDMLLTYVNATNKQNFTVVDIGAGTGNLTSMLLERDLKVVAIEPNQAMRDIGIQKTSNSNVTWTEANGTKTTLADKSADWVTFGSSFNVLDRDLALKETHRILKDDGYFSCMWNHRDLSNPIQKIAEDIIEQFVPEYTRGTRREDQRPIIEEHKDLFDQICYIETDFYHHQTIQNYILAWQSVKNRYWDLETSEGQNLFAQITDRIKTSLPSEFDIKYTTRCWSAKKLS